MRRVLIATACSLALTASAHAQTLRPLNSDSEPDRIEWLNVVAKFGPLLKPAADTKVGAVAKTLTTEYWRSLGLGYATEDKSGVDLSVGAGEAHALLGENGASQSTQLKILAG